MGQRCWETSLSSPVQTNLGILTSPRKQLAIPVQTLGVKSTTSAECLCRFRKCQLSSPFLVSVALDLPRAFRHSCDVAKRARKFWDFPLKGHRRQRGGLSVFRNPLHEPQTFALSEL